MRLPGFLPDRVRAAWDDRRIRSALAPLKRSPPTPCRPAYQADVEVHQLTCRRDLPLTLLSLKSLLARSGLRAAVCLTDDGSLDAADRQSLSRHLPGARWLPPTALTDRPDDPLKPYPKLAALYRSGFPFAKKLLHPLLLAAHEKVVLLDTDTAWFGRGEELVTWSRDRTTPPRYQHDHTQLTDDAVPDVVRSALTRLAAERFPGRRFGLDRLLFNAGLLAYRPAALDVAAAEAYVGWRETLTAAERQGRPGIWFGDWTVEQTAYLVMFALADPPAAPLDPEYWLGFAPDRAMNHFMRHYLVQGPTLRAVRQLAEELAAGPVPA